MGSQFARYIRDAGRAGMAWYTGGVVSVVVSVAGHFFGIVPSKVFWVIAVLCLSAGQYEAYRHKTLVPMLRVEGRVVMGRPDPEHVSTSYVERANLTMRMGMRRFTRLTNGFSKKIENHAAAVALHFQFYNFARVTRA